MEEQSLKQQHESYINRVKSNGVRTTTYTVPCCRQEVEDRAAPDGEVWDSMMICPHCNALLWKVMRGADATVERIGA